ncbi:anthranilate phosphoribosyltransferase [Adhaeretor mobilis]|uniref:Anthranilate phosphoribosyltransferase n=1 Tax=Adhaeretor mobilis TaxID=1930276 RepID=A0A517MZ45_9BACT|nr:anthranilate phosphoribosyltransferase [Adhaeretor mobilis]QDT00147.1 Anthranilate phosphoribosyltransferase [Adhaeretor mobilis]
MDHEFQSLLGKLSAGESLSRAEMAAAMGSVMGGNCTEAEISLLLTTLAAKGETVEELAGAAQAMRKHMTPIRSQHEKLLDTCGTGGGGSQTFNISTTAALVIAACGVPVAKHGNRSVTSRSGSADVLSELGVNIEASVPQVERCLNNLGICFCFAPLMHPAMRHVGSVRKKLGIRTIFNSLGPLSNPASATHQLMGVGLPEMRSPLAAALAQLGVQRALVVSGADGLGEVTLGDATNVTEVAAGTTKDLQYRPEDFGLETQSLEAIHVANPKESAAKVRSVLLGEPGPARDIVLLNAAAGLIAFDETTDPKSAVEIAAAVIDDGTVIKLTESLAELSHQVD